MVLGLAFLFCFSGTGIQNTFLIMVICNMIHFFSTPYLMMKESLAKMNASWETTAMLMGDSWIKTILRVVTLNAISTIIRVFSYYFINAMVTISAVTVSYTHLDVYKRQGKSLSDFQRKCGKQNRK